MNQQQQQEMRATHVRFVAADPDGTFPHPQVVLEDDQHPETPVPQEAETVEVPVPTLVERWPAYQSIDDSITGFTFRHKRKPLLQRMKAKLPAMPSLSFWKKKEE